MVDALADILRGGRRLNVARAQGFGGELAERVTVERRNECITRRDGEEQVAVPRRGEPPAGLPAEQLAAECVEQVAIEPTLHVGRAADVNYGKLPTTTQSGASSAPIWRTVAIPPGSSCTTNQPMT